MNQEYWKKLYQEAGFFWNENLAHFLAEYGGKKMAYPHYKTGRNVWANFLPQQLVEVGRMSGDYEATVDFLKEEIAPVGECNNGNIELLLSASGNLIGFADYLLLTWKTDSSATWHTSIKRLLEGEEPESMGLVP